MHHPLVSFALVAALAASVSAIAQSDPGGGERKPASSWADLGFADAPDGYPTDQVPLFEGLDRSRGGWAFRGTLTLSDGETPLAGEMESQGGSRQPMQPMWRLILGWPADAPQQVISYTITASPEAEGFKLMLFRHGPMPAESGDGDKPEPAIFEGAWTKEDRTVTWERVSKASVLPAGAVTAAEAANAPEVAETFTMVIAEDGAIAIRVGENPTNLPRIAVSAGERIREAPAENAVPGQSTFATAAEVSYPRLKACLPPEATEIVLQREPGGHFARYRVAEADFHAFLDALWESAGDSSAHKRDEMSGEGEPADQQRMAKRFERYGWEPLEGAVVYYSPSKGSGAMTTYYFDREAGIAYHDTGYW